MKGTGILRATPGRLSDPLPLMTGKGLLEAIPFSTDTIVGMHGTGSLQAMPSNRVPSSVARLWGTSALYAMRLKNSTPVDLTGSGELNVIGTTIVGGSAWMPNLISKGAEENYAESIQSLQPFYSYADDSDVPVQPDGGIAWISPLVSWGYAEGTHGKGEAFVPAFRSRGGDHNYSIGEAYVPAFLSWGTWTKPFEQYLFTGLRTHSDVLGIQEHIVIFNTSGNLVDSISASREAIGSLLESLEAQDSFTVLGSFLAALNTDINIDNQLAGLVDGKVNLNSSARIWVINMETQASGQYDNYGFTSFFEKDGKYYGVAEDGIYLLEGDADAGTNVEALIDIGKSDFGSPNIKHVPNVYCGMSSTGKLILKVEADNQVYYYEARSYSTDLKNHRFDTGLGLRGTYHNLSFINQDGNDFEFESISFEPVSTSRKI